MLPLLLGAGLGLTKSVFDQMQADRTRKAEAAKTRYGAWTGHQGQTVPDANWFGNALQGGLTGYMLGGGGAAAAPMTAGPGQRIGMDIAEPNVYGQMANSRYA